MPRLPLPAITRFAALGDFAAALLFGLVVWLALPNRIIAIDDDFGYLRSIVETWEAGHPKTHDFLVPHAVTTSTLACLLFACTGSMTFAVHGSQAACAFLAFAGALSFSRQAGIPRKTSTPVLWVILLAPSTLFMWLMLTSVPVYWACLWWAASAARAQRWGWFIVIFGVAVATRQSAIVWLALPGWECVRSIHRWWTQDRRIDGQLGPWLTVLAGIAIFALLKATMNVTQAQALYATRYLAFPGASAQGWVSPAALLGGLGWGCMIHGALRPQTLCRHRLARGFVLAIAGGCVAAWALTVVQVSHKSYSDNWSTPMAVVAGAVGGLGLGLHPRPPWTAAVWTGIGAMLPHLIYPSGFDYFYLETFFWGFIAGAGGQASTQNATAPAVRTLSFNWAAGIFAAACLTLLVWNARCWARHKLYQDRVSAFCELYEIAIRQGRLRPDKIGMAPFGYVGWRLDPYHSEHGRWRPGGFVDLTDPWNGQQGAGVVAHYPKFLKRHRDWFPTGNSHSLATSPEAEVIATLKAPLLGFWEGTFELKRIHKDTPQSGRLGLDSHLYTDHPFPLDDAEWRILLRGDRTLGLNSSSAPTMQAVH
jgi:hypothetical protein